MVALESGYYYNNTGVDYFTQSPICISKGDVVSICIDTQNFLLYLKLNGREFVFRKRLIINEQSKEINLDLVKFFIK